MTSTDAIAAKNAFVLITNTCSWSKANAFFAAIAYPCCHEIQSIGQLIFRVKMVNHGAWLDHESLSPAYFKLTAWIAARCTRMSMDIRVHDQPQSTRSTWEISSKTLSASSLTINAPLIVKDEVDKVFELILFHNKLCVVLRGLKAYCYLGPACPGPLKAQDRRVHDYYSNRIVII